jgi:hypothetical protein
LVYLLPSISFGGFKKFWEGDMPDLQKRARENSLVPSRNQTLIPQLFSPQPNCNINRAILAPTITKQKFIEATV